ncbi:NACHT domain-containing protein [Herbidospora sp. RD11066]
MRRADRVLWIVIVANVLTVLVAVTTNVATGVLPDAWQPHLWLAWPILITLVLAGIPLIVVVYRAEKRAALTPADPPASSRATMIAHVREIWVDGVLANSLYRRTVIELGLENRPDMLVRPWDVLLEIPGEEPHRLEETVSVRDVADRHRRLLILGAPGAGKTTMLLGLLEDLLNRAESDPDRPIPVVFPLAGWASNRKPLAEWLVDELSGPLYGVPRDTAAHWVSHDRILPLLDGLDEVAVDRRLACAKEIEDFHARNRLLPLIVASRLADYDALDLRLSLGAALVVQPLTRDQLEHYLDRLGEPLAGLRATLDDDASLGELLRTPFLLSVAVRAYEGLPAAHVGGDGSLSDRRSRLLTAFVDRALTRKPGQAGVAPADAVRWLAFVARSLGKRLETVFFPEFANVSWLPSERERGVAVATGLVSGLLIGSMAGSIVGLIFGVGAGVTVGVIGGLGWAAGQSLGDQPHVPHRPEWRQGRLVGLVFEHGDGCLSFAAAIGFGVVGAVLGLLAGLVTGIVGPAPFLASLATGIGAGVVGGVLLALPLGPSGSGSEDQGPRSREYRADGDLQGCARTMGVAAALYGGPSTVTFLAVFGTPGLVAGVLVIVTTSWMYGGRALAGYWLTRVMLTRDGVAPAVYARFFELAVARMLVHKVGGGWLFTHRLLLEHFAGLEPPDLGEGYRSGSLPSIDLRPETLLASALTEAREGRVGEALSLLVYTNAEMPADLWAPQAGEIALQMGRVLPPVRSPGDDQAYSASTLSVVVSGFHLVMASGHARLPTADGLWLGEIIVDQFANLPPDDLLAGYLLLEWTAKTKAALQAVEATASGPEAARVAALLARLEELGEGPDSVTSP